MSPQEFCYWLQGLLELQPDLKHLNESQVKMIRDHLGYVFTQGSTQIQKDKEPVRPYPGRFEKPAPFPEFYPDKRHFIC